MDFKGYFKRENLVRHIIYALCFLGLSIGFAFIEKYYFLDLPGSYYQKKDALLIFILLLCIGLVFTVTYLLNLFWIKSEKLHTVLTGVCFGMGCVFIVSLIINLIVNQPQITFDSNYISLFVTSSFTLLGFGLTAASILTPLLIKLMKEKSNEERTDKILSYFLPYIFLFLFGLAFTATCLLELEIKDTSFYKIIVFKALLYSITQILAIIVAICSYLVTFVFKENGLIDK